MLEPYLNRAIDDAVPAGVTHIGFIGKSLDGEYMLARPSDTKWGTTATFPKVKVEDGEMPAAALERCLREFQGLPVAGIYPLQQVWGTATSVSFFFAGLLQSNGGTAWAGTEGSMQWNSLDRCRQLLQESKNEVSRSRDLAVLAAVEGMCLSPPHRVLLMLRELHLMGYEQLRAPAYSYPIAWRCPIVPAAWTLKNHGHMYCDPRSFRAPLPINRTASEKGCGSTYSSASGQRPFGWKGVMFASPRQLAERFLFELPHIAALGWGPDGAYVDWFDRLLERLLKKHWLYSSCGEYNPPTTHLYGPNLMPIDLPPPGFMEEDDYYRFAAKFTHDEVIDRPEDEDEELELQEE